MYGKVKRASAAADRIFALMDMPASVTDPPHPLLLPRHREGIRFDKISFHYDNQRGDQAAGLALRDVSLHVEAGEVVAVLGENGCGKSTLVSLLPRYFDPTAGQVEIDGVNLREVKLRDLRRQIGVVTQETLLFDDTVSENIRYGLPEATASDIEQAARRAHVTAFLDHLPQGLQTNVGANGSRLSGGQRQRIALARAMLRDPAILILDEATSAVDAQSELLIHKSLAEFIPGRTVFIISHALNATLLDLVTRIVVMDAGRIVATGCHDSLMASCPVYQRLYRSQTARRAG